MTTNQTLKDALARMRLKTVHVGGGQKGKILSTQLQNDPLLGDEKVQKENLNANSSLGTTVK